MRGDGSHIRCVPLLVSASTLPSSLTPSPSLAVASLAARACSSQASQGHPFPFPIEARLLLLRLLLPLLLSSSLQNGIVVASQAARRGRERGTGKMQRCTASSASSLTSIIACRRQTRRRCLKAILEEDRPGTRYSCPSECTPRECFLSASLSLALLPCLLSCSCAVLTLFALILEDIEYMVSLAWTAEALSHSSLDVL